VLRGHFGVHHPYERIDGDHDGLTLSGGERGEHPLVPLPHGPDTSPAATRPSAVSATR